MADKTAATITYIDANGSKGTKSITDISPMADNGAIKNFCTALNALSTNTISTINKVEQTTITNATVKPKLTLTILTENLATLAISTSNSQALIATIEATRPALTTAALFYYPDNEGDPEANWIETPYPNTNPTADNEYAYFTGGYDTVFNQNSIGASCVATDTTISKIVVDYMFAETDSTAATTYRLTIRKTAGDATFVQI